MAKKSHLLPLSPPPISLQKCQFLDPKIRKLSSSFFKSLSLSAIGALECDGSLWAGSGGGGGERGAGGGVRGAPVGVGGGAERGDEEEAAAGGHGVAGDRERDLVP